MCLTLDALVVFLNLIGLDIVTTEPGRFIVHAEQGNIHWVETDGEYCAQRPQFEQKVRFKKRVSEG